MATADLPQPMQALNSSANTLRVPASAVKKEKIPLAVFGWTLISDDSWYLPFAEKHGLTDANSMHNTMGNCIHHVRVNAGLRAGHLVAVKTDDGGLTLAITVAHNQSWEAVAVAENQDTIKRMKSIMETNTEPCWYLAGA